MSQRIIKFRAWNGHKMYYDDLVVVGPLDISLNKLLKKTGKTFNLMQYTGLLDRNGKEIFEGDVVRFAENGPNCLREYEVSIPECYQDETQWSEDIRVIGNIYENPK